MGDHECMCPRCISIREVLINMYGFVPNATDDLSCCYILWDPTSKLPPTTAFRTRPDAIKCAHLMAVKNPGKKFMVCKMVGSAESNKSVYTSWAD